MIMLETVLVIFGSGFAVAVVGPSRVVPFVHRWAIYSLSASIALLLACSPPSQRGGAWAADRSAIDISAQLIRFYSD